MRRVRIAAAFLIVLAVLAIPSIAGADGADSYQENYWNHKDFWTSGHVGDDTPTWDDENNHVSTYDVEISLYDCRTHSGDISYDETVGLELRRQITLWPDQGYGESLFYCEDEDYHAWVGVDDNGTFFAELDEIMGVRSGTQVHLSRSFVSISP